MQNKGTDQLLGNRAADQRLCFRNIDNDVTRNTGVTLRCASKRRFLHFSQKNQRVNKAMLPYKAQYASLPAIKYIFEQFYVCVFSVPN